MSNNRLTARTVLASVIAAAFVGLVGCRSANAPTPTSRIGQLPTNLPQSPHPCKEYCKVWVPAEYRNVPKLVQVRPACTKKVKVPIKRMIAKDVVIRPRCQLPKTAFGDSCEDSLVQVKPGGYRWEENVNGCCWQYCYRKPEYKWCKKKVNECDVTYCAETPPVYKTVVQTCDDVRIREEYVPAEYKVRQVRECYKPAHWEWQERPGCGAVIDRRCWSRPKKMGRTCAAPPAPALDCGCPATN